MRARVLLFCGVILALCVWLLLRNTSKKNAQEMIANQQPTQSQMPQVRLATNALKTPVAPTAPLVAATGTSNAAKSQVLTLWQAPIEFYGKVIDQNSNPVNGATIRFQWADTPTEDGNRSANATSDAGGLFSLHGARGPDLAVSVSKYGYYSSREEDHPPFKYGFFSNGQFSPDALNPVIFHLYKKGKPEPLMRLAGPVIGPRQYRLNTAGTPSEISFYTGKRMPPGGGQFRVEYWMNVPQGSGQQRFDWHCRITVPEGGLQMTTEEFPLTAPKDDYQESIEIDSDTNAWSNRFEQKFYIHLPDGHYGRVDFTLACSTSPFFGVEALINPVGSKNLEYDKYLPGNILVDHSAP